MTPESDEQLVALARGGSDEAFDEIFRRYRGELLSYAARVGPPGQAEDVLQDAMVNAYAALARGEPVLKLRPWLYRIVRNTALNANRDLRPHQQLDPEQEAGDQPPEALERSQTFARLMAKVRSLPPAQRVALVRRELEGLSHQRIARELNTSAATVRQLIYRARQALRRR